MPATDYTHSQPAPVPSVAAGAVSTSLGQGGGSTTTYFYRATDGSRGSTTSEDSIPAGAVVEGIVTT